MREPGCIALQTFPFAETFEEFALIKHAPVGICFLANPAERCGGFWGIHQSIVPLGYCLYESGGWGWLRFGCGKLRGGWLRWLGGCGSLNGFRIQAGYQRRRHVGPLGWRNIWLGVRRGLRPG